MVWLEGGQIANLGQRRFTAKPSPDEAQWDGDALSEAKTIHLATDVRETAQEITGSSFLVERAWVDRSEEHTSELQSPCNLVCRLLLEKKKTDVILIAIVYDLLVHYIVLSFAYRDQIGF